MARTVWLDDQQCRSTDGQRQGQLGRYLADPSSLAISRAREVCPPLDAHAHGWFEDFPVSTIVAGRQQTGWRAGIWHGMQRTFLD